MREIQTACAGLARHQESYVARLALLIAEFDAKRDLDHENQIVTKDAQISTKSAELKVVQADNRLLRAKLNKLQDMQFGQKSEKGSQATEQKQPTDAQADKDAPGTEPEADAPKPDASKTTGTKPRGQRGRQKISIPANVPRDIRFIEPETGSICGCGCNMRPFGEQIIERLTFVPAQLRVIEEHYPKYVCRTCDKFVQAPVPKRAFEQTRFDDQLIAGLAISKFADFIPNYRQEQIFKRSGVQLHRSSIIDHR
ncbi:IS66 family transposase zinc-finger binding domain-containing protein [Shimia sp. MMG029]|uniref:IS66 family transposase zinc-finger binding domain-containing protein n=1 Tax=Shimia sp. MMG029 TaxID=3021978 RepID=UPI0022FEEBE5|nr:IS66 family transposase zinc-finger binding domain-containing protein [Shimia sp. MMG029]MDA5555139.1 IS66 family transposase zinc-finger binding domain-containing protein [Shimia sp. MMG029]